MKVHPEWLAAALKASRKEKTRTSHESQRTPVISSLTSRFLPYNQNKLSY